MYITIIQLKNIKVRVDICQWPGLTKPASIINRYKSQGRALDPLSGASPGELTIVPIPRPLPCWQGRGAGEGYIKLIMIEEKLLVQFTGIGCGPCYQSIPCLAKLRDQFTRGESEIINIETWNNNPAVIKKHISANHIGWTYLTGDPEVKESYAIRSVPKFFILDDQRVIRKIISGFDKETTCAELKEIVNEILVH